MAPRTLVVRYHLFSQLMRQRFFRIIRDKYFLATAFFLVWICFFDQNDVFTRVEIEKEINELKSDMSFYKEEVERLRITQEELQNSDVALERFAREKYYMKKDGEDIYVFKDAEE